MLKVAQRTAEASRTPKRRTIQEFKFFDASGWGMLSLSKFFILLKSLSYAKNERKI